jgi:hypothetical protein
VISTLANIIGAGGGGGSGLTARLSTLGGLVYLGCFVAHMAHVGLTYVRRGREAAVEELQEVEADEFG